MKCCERKCRAFSSRAGVVLPCHCLRALVRLIVRPLPCAVLKKVAASRGSAYEQIGASLHAATDDPPVGQSRDNGRPLLMSGPNARVAPLR